MAKRGGGTNWGLILLIGGGVFLLMRSGGLGGGLFGTSGPTDAQLIAAGYQNLGTGYWTNPQTGQQLYRNPTTGQVTPVGAMVGTDPWLAPLYQISNIAAPQIGQGIGTAIGELFNPATWGIGA